MVLALSVVIAPTWRRANQQRTITGGVSLALLEGPRN